MSIEHSDDPIAIDRPPNPGRRVRSADAGEEATTDAAHGAQLDAALPSLSGRTAVLYETRIALLQARIANLEAELEAERTRREAIVDRYETVLEDRDERMPADQGDALQRHEGDEDASLFERLRGFLGL